MESIKQIIIDATRIISWCPFSNTWRVNNNSQTLKWMKELTPFNFVIKKKEGKVSYEKYSINSCILKLRQAVE